MKCTGYHETCNCPDCEYVNQLYAELDFLENFVPEDVKEIERLRDEIESLGYFI